MDRKVFCIGMNKTGTTSLKRFMEIHGFSCNDQAAGELLIKSYSENEFLPILKHCETAEFFQDLPFSAPNTFKELKLAFPHAKFILTVRNSAEEWYDSLVRFHEMVFGKPLNKETLQKADYRYPGFAWEANRAMYSSPENDPYQRTDLIRTYENHIREVRSHFSGDQNFIEINVSEKNTVIRLCKFLEIEALMDEMPWLNKTETT